jgi:hypothetical protein
MVFYEIMIRICFSLNLLKINLNMNNKYVKTSKQANKQTSKQANKQTSKQANKQT